MVVWSGLVGYHAYKSNSNQEEALRVPGGAGSYTLLLLYRLNKKQT